MTARRHSEKTKAAALAYATEHSVALASKRFKLHPSLIYAWRQEQPATNKVIKRAVKRAAKRANGRHPISVTIDMDDEQSTDVGADRLKDIMTYADKAQQYLERQDSEGVTLYLTHIKRAAQGKE